MSNHKTYPGSIDQRPSGSWRWRVSIEGERFQETLEDMTREEAKRYAREKYNELLDQVGRQEDANIRLSRFLKRFEREEVPQQLAESSQRSYRATLSALRHYFGELRSDPRLRSVSKGDVKRFLAWRRWHDSEGRKREEPMSGYTVRTEHAIFRRVLESAHELELIPGNPAGRLNPPKVEEREPVLLTEDQLERLLAACEGDDMLHTYVLLLAEAGLRSQSEAPFVRWEDVDLEGGFLRVSQHGEHRTKSGKSRWVPMTARLRDALRDHAATYRLQLYDGDRSPWVLHHVASNRWGKPGDRRKDFRTAAGTAIEKAELPEGFRLHDLRHRRCTRWIAEGHSPALVRKAMGHSSLDVTLQYEHLIREDLQPMVAEEDERKELAELKG